MERCSSPIRLKGTLSKTYNLRARRLNNVRFTGSQIDKTFSGHGLHGLLVVREVVSIPRQPPCRSSWSRSFRSVMVLYRKNFRGRVKHLGSSIFVITRLCAPTCIDNRVMQFVQSGSVAQFDA